MNTNSRENSIFTSLIHSREHFCVSLNKKFRNQSRKHSIITCRKLGIGRELCINLNYPLASFNTPHHLLLSENTNLAISPEQPGKHTMNGPKAITRSLAKYLQQYLDENGFGWRQLAEKAGVPPSALSQLKTGKRKLTPELGAKIAKAMDISEGVFYMAVMENMHRFQREDYKAQHDVIYAGNDYIDGITQSLMATLGPGDKYWLIAIEPPIEFQDPALDKTLIESIKNGGSIHYVFPAVRSSDLLDNISDDKSEVTELFRSQGGIDLDTEFFLWQRGFAQRHKSENDQIMSNIRCYLPKLNDRAMFFAPFIKYIFIERASQQAEEVQHEAWLDVAYFNGQASSIYQPSEQRCALPLNPKAVYYLKKWCHSLREAAPPNKR